MQQHSEDAETAAAPPFTFFDSADQMSAVEQKKDLNKENMRMIQAENETSCQNPIFTAFAFSLNIDPKLLEIIMDGDEQVESLSGRSSPRPNTEET